jgi:hypothetical protein
MHRLTIILMALAGTTLLSGLNYQRAICATPPGKPVAIPTTAQPGDQAAQARVLGAKAYVWGYPLVISAATALVGTNTDKPLNYSPRLIPT